MNVANIYYEDGFIDEFKALPEDVKKLAVRKEELFRKNPLHPSLRLHKLKGKFEGTWSISINMKYRILFEMDKNAEVLFLHIGTHAIYDS